MTTREDNLKIIGELFHSQNLAVLSTQKNGQPYASLVVFSFSKDLKQIYFLTPADTRKYENIIACSNVALLIHSAGNRADDVFNAISVTAVGRAATLENKEGALAGFLKRHPQLSAFSHEPSTAMINVDVETYIMVNQFQNVVKLRMQK